eukprot:scaffold1307_cov200-Pinguiococcus_pyrenoidosus.AAC.13
MTSCIRARVKVGVTAATIIAFLTRKSRVSCLRTPSSPSRILCRASCARSSNSARNSMYIGSSVERISLSNPSGSLPSWARSSFGSKATDPNSLSMVSMKLTSRKRICLHSAATSLTSFVFGDLSQARASAVLNTGKAMKRKGRSNNVRRIGGSPC